LNLPKDPYMLVSFINCKLRDYYKSLDDFCECFNVSKLDITNVLLGIGYEYRIEENQFKAI
jgi:hypothetical protein